MPEGIPFPRRPGVYLGFDFGERRIGIAVGQTITTTARGIETLSSRRDGSIAWPDLTRVIAQWQPEAVVVGLPLHLDGTPFPFTHRARRFGNQLSGRYRLPVHFEDERLTSDAAARDLKQGDHSPKLDLDQRSAEIILEGWLQRQQPTTPSTATSATH
ncbi:MAG: Holliday junction resolvase RuvX [Gammaproteobacteria bacterium]|nr:Holliday junction resolvase RuvX [Gammaproteobacteria bacterium]